MPTMDFLEHGLEVRRILAIVASWGSADDDCVYLFLGLPLYVRMLCHDQDKGQNSRDRLLRSESRELLDVGWLRTVSVPATNQVR